MKKTLNYFLLQCVVVASFGQDEILEVWLTNEGESWKYKARTMVHWKKNDAGKWRIKSLIFNQAP